MTTVRETDRQRAEMLMKKDWNKKKMCSFVTDNDCWAYPATGQVCERNRKKNDIIPRAVQGGHMPIVSITRLRVRSWSYLPTFFVQTLRIALQAARADGSLAV